jgi:hypothetical protein
VIDLAAELGVTRGSVNRWLQWYEALGVDGLLTGVLPVRRIMGPPGRDFRRVMGPPPSQHDGATGEREMTLLSQGHGATLDLVFAGSWGHPERAT